MKVTVEEVRRIAALAHLEVAPEAEERLRGHLEKILDYVEKLAGLDTSGVEPPGEGAAGPSPLREDSPVPSLPAREALSNAPDASEGLFRVPRILPG